MTVYVLENGCYSDTHIVGLYSTREKAEIAARIFHDDASITEWDVDEKTAEMRDGCVPFFVRLNRETGHVIEAHQETSSYGVGNDAVGQDIHKNLFTRVWATSSEHAVKIAADRRRMFLAQVTA